MEYLDPAPSCLYLTYLRLKEWAEEYLDPAPSACIWVPPSCEEGFKPAATRGWIFVSGEAQEIKFSSEFPAYYKVMGCPEGWKEKS